ncbi:SIR2 family protein [Streptosporangium sp. NPDC001559]|uniref:SIR2 family NAD-dependent protein deacylase n=1 Tax=Streptosporangium sp. NPDC001559 TaxID=3366187 RepID=UPI0036ECA3DA
MGEAEWERLLDQLKHGDCTPFLGSGACAGVLPTGTALSRNMARRWDYPFDNDYDLPRVAQFAAMRYGDPVYVKRLVCQELDAGAVPDFLDPLEPHSLLASFPLPVYLTTNYDDFIFRSLEAAGKSPDVAVCAWNDGLAYAKDLFAGDGSGPRPDRPLVYHLHGRLGDPASIVLVEDDYLEFVANLALDSAADGQRMLPTSILEALTRRPILFMGYSLQDWTFRFLFHSLVKAVPGINRRRHVSVQLAPSPAGARADILQIQRDVARYYEDWRISIFWGTARDFCRELRRRMGPVP